MSSFLREDEDGYSSISGATLEKARVELNEDPSTRAAVIRQLRSLIVRGDEKVQCVGLVYISR